MQKWNEFLSLSCKKRSEVYLEYTKNLLSMKFMIAKVGPMLRTVLKVSKLICPPLKAIIVKAFSKEDTNYVKIEHFLSKLTQ